MVLQAVVNAGAAIPRCPISWSCCGVLTTMSASRWRVWSLVQKFYKSVFFWDTLYVMWKVLEKIIFLDDQIIDIDIGGKFLRLCSNYLITNTKLRTVPFCLVWQKPGFDISDNFLWTPQTRVEICRDRHDRCLCKNFASCVIFSETGVFLHNYYVKTCKTWCKVSFSNLLKCLHI